MKKTLADAIKGMQVKSWEVRERRRSDSAGNGEDERAWFGRSELRPSRKGSRYLSGKGIATFPPKVR